MEAAEGLVLATAKPMAVGNPVETEATASGTLPPMMKFAMLCATKGEGSAKPKGVPRETSSEGSSTEGGC